MANTRVSGIAFIKSDGKQYQTAGEFTINMGTPMREPKIGTVGIVGYNEKPQAPSIECKIVLTPGLSLEEITNLTDATITVVAPNGTSFVLREAFFSGDGNYATGEGEVAAKFSGTKMEEITA